MNNFTSYELKCDIFNVEHFKNYVKNEDVEIHYFDMDIQGHETIVQQKEMYQLLCKKVHFLKIGTHTREIHDDLKTFFKNRNWTIIRDIPLGFIHRIAGLLRVKRDWQQIRNQNVFYDSKYGPITNWDGDLFLKNPNF